MTVKRPRTKKVNRSTSRKVSSSHQRGWDILGNSRIATQLRRESSEGLRHHAFVLAGADGVGKTALARQFAASLICTQLQPNSEPCGTCISCRTFDQGRHVDIVMISGEASDQIGIDVVRSLISSIQQKPAVSRRRVCIIEHAEQLTEEASNALLKVLEEPSGATVFILTTIQRSLLSPTVLSRCLVYELVPVHHSVLQEHLIQQGVEPDTALSAAVLSTGRIGIALGLIDPERRRTAIDAVSHFLRQFPASVAERLQTAETTSQVLDSPAEKHNLLDRWESTVRRLVRSAAGMPDVGPLDHDIQSTASSIGLLGSLRTAADMFRLKRNLTHSPNVRLVTESFFLHLPRP